MKRNVLFIMVDSLRADHCWGTQRRCETPTLDRLRRQAVVCTQAFSTASTTTTSATSILTGAYPFVHGINTPVSGQLRPSLPTLPEVLKRHGYHTWAEMTGPLEPATGLSRGFDSYRHRPYADWLDTGFGDRLVAKLRGDLPRPWFGFLHLWELHHPRRITAEHNRAEFGQHSYARAVSSLDRQLAHILEAAGEETIIVLTGDYGEYLADTKSNELVFGLKQWTSWLKRHSRALMHLRGAANAALLKTAHFVRRRESDFVRAWQGHGFHVYDSLIHVPLIFYGPGVFPRGLEVTGLTSHVDIVPTLLAALDLDPLPLLSGIDLMPYIRQPSQTWPERAIYTQASGAHGMVEPRFWLASVRTERYKYVRSWSNQALPEELYDLKQDPAERANLAGHQPDTVRKMRARLDELYGAASASLDMATNALTADEPDQLSLRLRDLGYQEH